MRIKTILIALVAMMLFAVQGYAQRENREARRSQTEQRRSSSKSNRGSSYQYSGSREKNTTRATPPKARDRQISTPQRSADRTRVASSPQRTNNRVNQTPSTRSYQRDRGYNVSHGGYRPIYNHHKSYHHHHHRCIFDNWNWYYWGGYNNRFIRHAYYHNRFFDSMLGYYLWGAFDRPTRIEIGDLSIIRRHSDLKISTGYETTYLDLYRYHRVVYRIGHTRVEITTTQGYANIYIYDEYGNTATYRL